MAASATELLFGCALTCIHSISQFYSWVAGKMGVKFLAQGKILIATIQVNFVLIPSEAGMRQHKLT